MLNYKIYGDLEIIKIFLFKCNSEFGIAAKELSNIASSSHFTICIESVENLMLISSDVGETSNNSKLCKCLKKIIIFQDIVNT
ncbi:hypothetical protein Anas_14233 [Armadillidium nasatum]|uniref:Uncharacterized protein n=1 Tax=Armadillidium nasatum TaxID=96803 RepID=A0A5N5T8P8_9CRUS|nr:hypothetical protein Anas_14233 [Armadillidium nasatum]